MCESATVLNAAEAVGKLRTIFHRAELDVYKRQVLSNYAELVLRLAVSSFRLLLKGRFCYSTRIIQTASGLLSKTQRCRDD